MEDEKYIDEGWKNSVDSEKKKDLGGQHSDNKKISSSPSQKTESESQNQETIEGEGDLPEVNFIGYITGLAFQAMIFLGEVPNPMTDKSEKNLRQAKFMIDTLGLIREKTKGNLDTQEIETINAFLYELQMKFVQASEAEIKGAKQP